MQRALGTQAAEVAALGDELRQVLAGKGPPRELDRLIARLADALHPEDPLQARMELLQIAGLATLRERFAPSAIHGLAQRLLPAKRVAGAVARFGLITQRISPNLWDPAPAAIYLRRLDLEFPSASEQALARGRVFESLARTGHKVIEPAFLPPRMMETLTGLLGRQVDDPGMLFAELMFASLEADPDNREGYRFLLDRMRGYPARKPRLRSLLQEMAARFPDDPAPWLELATLDYSRNAYRRAEHALAEARQRAPHDERILDLQAVGFLKSADQSRKSGRFGLADRDLRRAEDLNRPGLDLVLRVKRLLLAVVASGEEPAAVITSHLEPMPSGRRLELLALLAHDLEENRRIKNVSAPMRRAVRERLAGEADAAVDVLAADEVEALFAPLPTDLHLLYEGLRPALVLADWWPALMARLDEDRLLPVFDFLLGCGGRGAVRAEIDRRLRGVGRTRRDRLLLFYLAVVRHLEGFDFGSRRFAEALNGATPADRERMRAAAARLARHAHGPLRQALLELDFTWLDAPPPDEGLPPLEDLPPLFGEEESTIEALLDRLLAPMGKKPAEEPSFDALRDVLADPAAGVPPDAPPQGALFDDQDVVDELTRLEMLIDRRHLRGVPASRLTESAGRLGNDPEIRRNLERLAGRCEAAGLSDTISPELRTLLFPGGGGSEGRDRSKGRRG